MNSSTIDVVMIGAGNLATHSSNALVENGIRILQVYSRTEISAKDLALKLSSDYTTDIASLNPHASLYIIAVKDDAIAPLIEKMPRTESLVVHMAGSIPMDVFSGKLQNYGVMYPLQTFSKKVSVNFAEIPVFVEANTPENLEKLKQVAGKISTRVYSATSAERQLLHLSAVFGCNFVNFMYDIASQIVGQAGFEFETLVPLIMETARKAVHSGNPHEVQTGPAVRNDQAVLQKHMNLLSSRPDLQEVYKVLSENIGKCRL